MISVMIENCTNRFFIILLLLLTIVQETSQDKQVTYLLARPAENCTSACASRGMSCIEVGAFPNNALSIFHSINVTCTTPKETSWYYFSDSPNYGVSGDWKGRCMGFKGLNETVHFTQCGKGSNPTVRRLCPCKEPILTTVSPSTKTIPATTTPPTPSSSSEITSTRAKLLGTQTKNQYTDDKTELSSWLIAVIATAVLLVISGLFVVVIFVKKNRRGQSKSPLRIRSAPEPMSQNTMNGSDNVVYIESMVDMKSQVTSLPTDNILYESGGNPYETFEPKCQLTDELYALSREDETQGIMMTSANPIYEESVADEHRNELRGGLGGTGEYASIDEV